MNPQGLGLTVLTGMIAPAVLISACGPLLLSTTIRFGRVVTRGRELSDRLEKMVHGKSEELNKDEKIEIFHRQLALLVLRATILQRGMLSIYAGLACFIASSVSIGLAAFAGLRGTDWVAVTFGILGTLSLLYGSLALVRESRVGMQSLRIEVDFIYRILGRQGPKP